jgi:molecular chaperone IbpA
MRTNFDLSPYRRSTVGFDRLFDSLERGLRGEAADGYPPFDILKEGDDSYRISLAVAGYDRAQIEIVAQQNQLCIKGNQSEDAQAPEYLHRGISTRAFERRFQLADFVEVVSANLENGILTVTLKRIVPEAMKPRTVEISPGSPDRIEGAKEKVREQA